MRWIHKKTVGGPIKKLMSYCPGIYYNGSFYISGSDSYLGCNAWYYINESGSLVKVKETDR